MISALTITLCISLSSIVSIIINVVLSNWHSKHVASQVEKVLTQYKKAISDEVCQRTVEGVDEIKKIVVGMIK